MICIEMIYRVSCCLNTGNYIKENPQAVADFRARKEKALNSLVGTVMKKTKGRADARTASEMLLEKLGK